MKTAFAMILIGILILGCTGTAPGTPPAAPTAPGVAPTPPGTAPSIPGAPLGPIDCKGDAECINQAIRNGCQDAFLESRIDPENYRVGSANLRVTVTNEKTSCRVIAVQTDIDDEVLATVEANFRLPLEKCGTDDDPQSYMTVDGKCRWVALK